MSTERNYKTLEKNQGYYAAYANLALHNAYITLQQINSNYVEKKNVDKEENVLKLGLFEALIHKKVDNKDMLIAQLERIENKLEFHFPFLEMILKSRLLKKNENEQLSIDKLKEYGYYLKDLISMLIEYRNYTTHYYGGKPVFNENVIHHLRKIFDASKDTIRDRFGYSSKEVEHLVRYDRNKGNYPNTKLKKDQFGFHYSFYKKDDALSESGLQFLICIFLETRDAQLFLKKFYGLKDSRSNISKATLHCFTALHIRLPYDSISSYRDAEMVALDTINELRKAPKPLFNALIPVKQNLFRTNEETEDEQENEPLLLRSKSRFEELAMYFFDSNDIFKNLRFAVHYGRFYYRSDKKVIINESLNRWLTKDLMGFVRMNDVRSWKENENIKSLLLKTNDLDENHNKPYIQDREPEFMLQSNRILISLNPTACRTDFEKNEENYKRPKSFELQETFYISGNDFHNFVFYYLLTTDSNKIEGEIRGWMSNFNKLKSDITNGKLKCDFKKELNRLFKNLKVDNNNYEEEYQKRKDIVQKKLQSEYGGIQTDDIPDSWKDYLMGVRSFSLKEWQSQFIDKLIKEAEQIKDYYKKQFEYRKNSKEKNIKLIDTGKLSEILAKDMVKMMQNNDEKPNSSEYVELQKTMAFWGIYKNSMTDTFKKAKLFENIPFLNEKMVNNKGIYSYFQSYFEEKVTFLKSLKNSEATLTQLYFLPKRNEKLEMEQLKKSIQNIEYPFALPSDFFARKCIDYLNKNEKKQDGKVTQRLLAIYDKHQEFYDWKRTYELFDRWLDDRKSKMLPREQKEISLEKRQEILNEIKSFIQSKNVAFIKGFQKVEKDKIKKLRMQVLENEELIRWEKVKDKLLFELAKTVLQQKAELKGLENLTLNTVGPDKNVLNQFISFSLPYTTKKTKVDKTIVDPEMKIKDYGKFKRLLKDKRLDGFLGWVDVPEVKRADILKEWEEYEVNRVKVMEAVLDCEKTCAIIAKEHFENLKIADPNGIVQHRPYLEWMKNKGYITENEINYMVILRNKFSHNQYPTKEEITIQIKPNISVAKQLTDAAINYYETAMKKMRDNGSN